MRRVASATPSTIGMPRSRASEAKCDVLPPRSVTTPDDAREDVTERRPGHSRHQHVAGRDAPDLALAVDHHGASGAPADARRMAVEPRVLQPDLVGHVRRLQVQRPRLQQLEPVIVDRPFDLDRQAEHILGLQHHAGRVCETSARVEARLDGVRGRDSLGRRRATMAAADARGPCARARRAERSPSRSSSKRSGVTSPCAIDDAESPASR